MTVPDFVQGCRTARDETIREIADHMSDAQYKLEATIAAEAQRVRKLNEERRRALTHKSSTFVAEQVAPKIYEDMRKLGAVLNLRFEAGLLDCFQRSLSDLSQHFECQTKLAEAALGRDLA